MSERKTPATIDELTAWMSSDLKRKKEKKQHQVVPAFWYANKEGKQVDSLSVGEPYYIIVDIPISSALKRNVEEVYGQDGETLPGLYVTLYNADQIQFGDVESSSVPTGTHFRLIAPVTVLSGTPDLADCTYDLNLHGHTIGEGSFQIPVRAILSPMVLESS